MDLEEEISALYAGERDAFVASRDALAKRLRKDGDKEAAGRVKALRKPTVAAWAVDRLAHEAAKDVRALLDSVEELRAAQEAAVGGDAARFREASAAHRDALDRLVETARAALGDEGSEATIDKVRETLQTASLDDDARGALARGRLEKELGGGGFGLGSFAGDVPAKPRRSASSKRPASSKGRAGAKRTASATKADPAAKPPAPPQTSRRELRRARADLLAARKRAEAAERRHERAQAAFFAAEEKRDAARKQLEDALSERDGLEATVRRLERG
jgi:hypothetical protein